MKARFNTDAARANMKRNIIRKQAERLEERNEERKKLAIQSIKCGNVALARRVLEDAELAEISVRTYWEEIEALRVIIDAGTTYEAEPRDLA